MCDLLAVSLPSLLAATSLREISSAVWPILLMILGFSAVIFVHELGHFAVAKWCGVRVEKFAIGFLREVVGFTRGETRYSLNILPLGGYVKMLGQEDFDIDKSGELVVKDDPRSFTHKPVGQRMLIVSAGVVMNMIFAALIFMVVFTVGKKGLSTEVGYVRPNWPADHAGFEPGDVIESIDGTRINEFSELNAAILLADPLEPLNFEVRRGGEIRHFRLTPHNNEDEGILQIGIGPAVTRVVGALGPTFDPKREDHLQPDDVVVELNGQAVTDENANLMMYRLMSAPAEITDLAVERSDGKGGTRRVKINLPIQFGIYPADPADRNGVHAHVLGLTPLVKVASVDSDSRAFFAGMKAGDIIVRWDERLYPTQDYINSSVLKYPEIDIPIVVERAGKRISLTVRPKAKMRFGRPTGPAQIGAEVNLPATELLRIGAVTDSIDGRPTPAAQAGIPEGALITQVNEQPVTTWLEFIDRLRAAAGGAVTLTFNHENKTGLTCSFEVPHCARTLLKLPPHARITAIDNQESVNIELSGVQRTVAVSSPLGLREILKEKIGKTVSVTYTPNAFEGPRTAELPVTADMVDPWLGRILYYVDVRPLQATKVVKAEGPIDAIAIGIKKTIYFIAQVYATMDRMIFSRSVGVENLSGPVGIVKLGRDIARVGFVELLYFLAMISANLAVINFLPLPIVDGGLMVFLLIEKIKGSPVNLKVQMATQVIGLILIGAAFIFVTIQDLTK